MAATAWRSAPSCAWTNTLAAGLFRNWRHGLTCFLGNLLPIGMAFGVWGLWSGNVDLGLTVAIGIAFSVVIDDQYPLHQQIRACPT